MMKRFVTIFSLMAFFVSSPVMAGESQPVKKPLTLNQAISIAIHNNIGIKISKEDKKKALAEYQAAKAQRIPFINAEIRSREYPKSSSAVLWPYGYLYNKLYDTANSGLSEYYNIGIYFGLSAVVSLYDAKKNRTVDAARTSVTLSRLQARKSINEVIFNLKRAYYTLLMTREIVRLREDLVVKNEERLRVAKILFRGGQRPVLDVSKAEVGLSEARLNYEKARNKERDARAQLFMLMGIEDDGDDLALDEFTAMPELRYTLKDLYKLSAEYDPDIQIARANKKIFRAKVALEKAQHLPTVDLFASAGYENGNLSFDSFSENFRSRNWNTSFAFGFTARIPVYSGGAISAKVRAAKAEYNKMIYREKETILSKKNLLQNSVASLKELRKQVAMSELSVESAEKHLKLAKRTYQSGQTTQLELNDAIISVINAELANIGTKYEYLITIAKISSIVGLGENNLCKK